MRVSIGMPVYNGDRYLEEALTSILEQTVEDFELIICDNASTDRTEEICRRFARSDGRIRYSRSPENIGAARNFNRAVMLARGEYFKWAAHDDLCAPAFLDRCLGELDRDPEVVIAYPRAVVIGANAETIKPYDIDLRADVPSPSKRFQSILEGHKCFEIFGVIRRDILLKTPLIGAFSHGDGVLLAELALHGRFREIPEYLFFGRRHSRQSMAMLGDYRRYAVWFNPELKNRMVFPYWRMQYEHLRSILRARLPTEERWRCISALGRITVRRRHSLLRDVTYQGRRLIRRLFGLGPATGRVSFEAALERIRSAFYDEPHRLYDVRRKHGGSGEDDTIELTFISPEVGARYQETIGALSYTTGWFLTVAPEPNREAVLDAARQLLEDAGVAGELSYLPEELTVVVRMESDAAADERDLQAAFTLKTGFRMDLMVRSSSHV